MHSYLLKKIVTIAEFTQKHEIDQEQIKNWMAYFTGNNTKTKGTIPVQVIT